MAERLTITIDGDSSGLQKALQSAENRLNTFNQRVTNSSRNLTRLMGTMKGMNSSMVQMISAANSAAASLNRAAIAANRFSSNGGGISRSVRQAHGDVGRLNLSFRNLILTIYSVRTLMFTGQALFGGVVGSIMKINGEYEKQQIMLENLSAATTDYGKKLEAAKATRFIWSTAETAPFDLSSIQDTFIKLKVNGIDPTNGSMRTLLDTVAAFGGTSENLKLATLAISQMSSKGVVSMEELRRQLGEQVPTAIKAMAVGLGYIKNIHEQNGPAMRKFYKEISSGAVESAKAIPAMMKVLNNEYKGSAERMMNTWNGQMARLQQEYQKMIIRVTQTSGANSLFVTLKKHVTDFTNFLKTQKGDEFIKSVQEALAGLVNTLVAASKFVWAHREAIKNLAIAFVALWTAVKGYAAYKALAELIGASIVGWNRLKNVTDGARAVTLLFGRDVRRAAGEMGLFNATLQVSKARLLALVAPYAMVAAVIGTAVAIGTLYIKVTEVKGRASKEATKALELEKQKHKELTKAIDETVVSNEKERKSKLASMEVRKKEILQRAVSARAAFVEARAVLLAAQAEAARAAQSVDTVTQNDVGIDAKFSRMAKPIATRPERQKEADAIADYNERARALKELGDQFKETEASIKELQSMDLSFKDFGDDDGKKKHDPLGDLDGSRSQLVNLMMQVKQMQAELNGTSEAFEDNAEAIELQTRAEVDAIKSQDLLNSQIVHQRSLLPGLRSDLREYRKEKEQLQNLEHNTEDQLLKTSDAIGKLDDSYNSIANQVERYRKKLEEQNKEALNVKNPEDQAEVLRALTAQQEIDLATRKKSLELQAIEAEALKSKSREMEDYYLTAGEVRDRDYYEQVAYIEGLIEENKKLYGPDATKVADQYYRYLENIKRKYQVDKNPLAKWAIENRNMREDIGASLSGSLDGFIGDLANGKMAFKSFAKSLLMDLAKIIIRALLAKAILSAIGMGGGISVDSGPIQGLDAGGVMSFAPSVAHTGGVAGSNLGSYGNVPASLFAFAQRYHTGGFPGLKQNEIPVIVEKGEGIFTKEQMKSMGGSKAPVAPQVNIINQTGTQVEQKDTAPRFDGEKFVVDVLLKHGNKPGPIREMIKGK